MNQHEFMRIYHNFYVFLREGEYTIVSPTAVSEEKGRQWVAGARQWRDLGGSGEPGRDDNWILGASREPVGSRGEMAVADAAEKQI
jgi:hypothetical protein